MWRYIYGTEGKKFTILSSLYLQLVLCFWTPLSHSIEGFYGKKWKFLSFVRVAFCKI
jgi:hypothetical protein